MSDMKCAFENGRSWYATIQTLIQELNMDDDATREAAEQQIQEGPLSVTVRDGWRSPGGDNTPEGPHEYEILLSTGGPALRIYGRIGDHNEPESAELQAQDWGTPWTCVPDCDEAILLAYAQQFYFG